MRPFTTLRQLLSKPKDLMLVAERSGVVSSVQTAKLPMLVEQVDH